MEFTPVETRILNRIQKDFPAVPDPLRAMAVELPIPDDQFLLSVRALKDRGVIRSISGIFNADRLGYASALVAFIVNEAGLDAAASCINAHPGVSHNYQRDHRYNLWFTLAAESDARLEQTVKVLAAHSGAEDFIILRTERLIKIGLMLPIGDAAKDGPGDGHVSTRPESAASVSLSADERETVRILQKDLPVEHDPFSRLLEVNDSPLKLDRMMHCYRRLKQEGILRRYAAVLRHRKAGYLANAMTVWKPREGSDIERVVQSFRENRTVSHLYLRTLYPGKWEYPLFAMVHARTDDDLNAVINDLSSRSGIDDYHVLRSLREFKKERVIYYSPRFAEWERQAGL